MFLSVNFCVYISVYAGLYFTVYVCAYVCLIMLGQVYVFLRSLIVVWLFLLNLIHSFIHLFIHPREWRLVGGCYHNGGRALWWLGLGTVEDRDAGFSLGAFQNAFDARSRARVCEIVERYLSFLWEQGNMRTWIARTASVRPTVCDVGLLGQLSVLVCGLLSYIFNKSKRAQRPLTLQYRAEMNSIHDY